uniref:MATE family efflux transporter n=1 Tax=Altererythrobacter segetis TaxID=1104773 RepID=UPI001FAEFCF4|nr:MATE family efflux transporter [Altererythrobacter segetis]
MSEAVTPHTLNRASIFAQAWPIMLGQASIPLVGVVDALVIGRTGDAAALAGVALGATTINLVFWTFGFLRMGMTGLTAQAAGAGDQGEIEALLVRGLAAGGAIGLVLLVLMWPLREIALAVFAGGETVTEQARAFVTARFIGAPASLAVFAINGWLFGLGRTSAALGLQLVMNLANVAFDVALVFGLGMGAAGVGFGTSGAEWVALFTGLALVTRVSGASPLTLARKAGRAAPFAGEAMTRLFAINRDLMIRTIALLILFAWFANAGARLGAVNLAANHVLMQFVSVAAFILDAFAFTAESRIGQAIGARSRPQFVRAARLTFEFSFVSGLALALLFWSLGGPTIDFVTTDPAIRATAHDFLPFAAVIPLIGMPSWMLDGIFIGATRGRALRNAGVVATLLYLATDFALRPLGNLGVWVALCSSYLFRAGSLGLYVPSLLRSLDGRPAVASATTIA